MEGFFVWDYFEQFADAEAELTDWYKQGKIKPTERVFKGLESAPEALQSLFAGVDTGIKVIEL